MDRLRNPYTPNAGARPPELAGRESVLHEFEFLLDRIADGRTEKGLIITGLRGVGKTVLLSEFEALAQQRNMVVVRYEAAKSDGDFERKIATLARRALLSISPQDRWRDKAKHAAGVLSGFKAQWDPEGRWTLGYEGPSVAGLADSGDLVSDLPDLICAVGEAARDHGRALVLLLDEIQYLRSEELSAIVMAKHRVNQLALPVVLSGAGLPQLPGLTAEAQTYAERMFTWPELGPLPTAAAKRALEGPAESEGASFDSAALNTILDYTEGYPYFLQEYGKAVWNAAATSRITEADALAARPVVEEVLDQDFFALRVGSLPDQELAFVRALASFGPGSQSPGDIARAMGRAGSSEVGSFQRRLTEKGLIYSEKRGRVAFTVPQFDRYVLRTFAD